MATEIRVPTLGESVTEATVGQWFKKVGDTVAADEPLVELETDKVTLEVPAPVGRRHRDDRGQGRRDRRRRRPARLDRRRTAPPPRPATASAAPDRRPEQKTSTTRPIGAGPEQPRPAQPPEPPRAAAAATAGRRVPAAGAAPSAQKIISRDAISTAAEIAGTGKDGRITKADALAAVADGGAVPAPRPPRRRRSRRARRAPPTTRRARSACA